MNQLLGNSRGYMPAWLQLSRMILWIGFWFCLTTAQQSYRLVDKLVKPSCSVLLFKNGAADECYGAVLWQKLSESHQSLRKTVSQTAHSFLTLLFEVLSLENDKPKNTNENGYICIICTMSYRYSTTNSLIS